MSYEPRPGTVAYRALAWLQTQPPGTELTTSRYAEAIDSDATTLTECLRPAVDAGAVERFTRHGARRPYFWRLPQAAKNSSTPEAFSGADGSQTPDGDAVERPAESGSEPRARRGAVRDGEADSPSRGSPRVHAGTRTEHASELTGHLTASRPSPDASNRHQPMRIAVWSDGVLEIRRHEGDIVLLTSQQRQQLTEFLCMQPAEHN